MTDTALTYEAVKESADAVASRLPKIPSVAVVLGSGLDAFIDSDYLKNKTVIPYREIPRFPTSTVSYQKGLIVAGEVGDRYVMFFVGRFHFYEGWEMRETAYPVMLCKLLGISALILTCAVGGIASDRLAVGDIVCITDHIKLTSESPDRGRNIPEFGERFYDMQSVYSKAFRACAYASAEAVGVNLRDGVYAYMSGPQFETPAEIRALRILGADVVGMSTVAEVIEAAHCGIPVLVLACVTNMAAGITGLAMNEAEVLETGKKQASRFMALLNTVLTTLPLNETK